MPKLFLLRYGNLKDLGINLDLSVFTLYKKVGGVTWKLWKVMHLSSFFWGGEGGMKNWCLIFHPWDNFVSKIPWACLPVLSAGPAREARQVRQLFHLCQTVCLRNRDNSSTRQLIDTVFGDNSSTQLKTTHRHFLKTIHWHICLKVIGNHR